MKEFVLVLLSLGFIFGCANKHPYNYVIDKDIANTAKPTSAWLIENTENVTALPMTKEKKSYLTNEIFDYLKTEGLNVHLQISNDNQIDNKDYKECFIVKTKIIKYMAKITQNTAGWHGTTEDPLDFWSHFTPGGGMQFVSGEAEALSLYVEVHTNGKKYYENAGGIELVGKYNKYSGRLRTKDEIISDKEKFKKAIVLAFKPLIETLK